jgi:hypothetical protein
MKRRIVKAILGGANTTTSNTKFGKKPWSKAARDESKRRAAVKKKAKTKKQKK